MRVQALALVAALAGSGCTTGLSLTLTAAAEEPVAPTAIAEAALVDSPPPTTSPPTTVTSAITTTTTDPPPQPIVLGFAGDVNMIRGAVARRPLDGVTDLLSAPDVMMVNLETVIGEAGEVGSPPIPKEFIFRSPPEMLLQLIEAGVDVVGLANNHAWDYGPLGATITAEYVAASDLAGIGVGADTAAAHSPVFIEVAGRTVGVASLTLVPCAWARDLTAERPEIAYGCTRFAVSTYHTIVDLLAGSDVSVVLVHAGDELADCPSSRTREVITAWMKFGIDVVAVSHPHVLGGVERVGDGVVLWSTGNFAFVNGGGRTARSAVFEVTVGVDDVSAVRVRPTVLPGAIASAASPETAALIREEIGVRSPGATIDDAGLLVADASPSICDGG